MVLLQLWVLGLMQVEAGKPLEFALVEAARAGMAANVRHYLELGADVDSRVVGEDDCIARTALISAIEGNHEEAVLVLLDEGADPDARGSDGRSPLLTAMRFGSEEILRYLIEAGANADAGLGGPHGVYGHVLGTLRNNVSLLNLLLTAGANPNVVLENGETPLIRAASYGRIGMVRALLNAEASVDAVDLSGSSVLLRAVKQARQEVVRLLIAAGADVDAGSFAEAPLMAAARRGPSELVQLLLDSGASVDGQGWMGRTALILAAKEGRLEHVELLVDAGATVNLLDDSHLTALDWAIFCEHEEVTVFLESVGARSSRALEPRGRKR